MPSSREEEPRRRKKSYDRDSPKPASRDKDTKERHKSSARKTTTRRRSDASREYSPSRPDKSTLSERSSKKVTMLIPEMERRSSIGDKRPQSYPNFSKAHSREAVAPGSESATDVHDQRPRTPADMADNPSRVPPSPPLTADDPDLRRAKSGGNMRKHTDRVKSEAGLNSRRSMDNGLRVNMTGSAASSRRPSPSSVSETSAPSTGSTKYNKAPSQPASNVSQTTVDSQATSVAPERKPPSRPPPVSVGQHYSPQSRPDSSPRTPTPQDQTFPSFVQRPKSTPGIDAFPVGYSPRSAHPDSVAMPPPPPPPPMVFHDTPRVDYLLQNGGLPYLISKSIVPSANNQPVQSYAQYQSPRIPSAVDVQHVFAPVSGRLEDIAKVLSKSGSLAVATGYRSVARRLLDRLEAVFARSISHERCQCVLCLRIAQTTLSDDEDTGISWGEILEYVAGRRELPQWPPFSLSSESAGFNLSGVEPMQKLDPDVPDEYRAHYIKQNAKTKRSVQDWLVRQPDAPSSPPQEVDDETLTFAVLTHIEPERRPLFTALMKGLSTIPSSRAPTPANEPKNEVLAKTAAALQRLYRLPQLPRDPECTIYLLNNLQLHSMLATLAAVSAGEWDILVSGRFDGFLWSGAETVPPSAAYGSTMGPMSRTTTPFSGGVPSRNTTPFSPLRNVMSPDHTANLFPSRGTTPAPGMPGGAPAPVQMDEETEIAVLAQMEREIYRGMEALEDQFEVLHRQAEAVRQRLRERSAGLAMAAKARRGSMASDIGVRIGTPGGPWDDEQQSIFDDGRSELAPDDSASNIDFGRKRRSKRHDRRTPAVPEEDEGVDRDSGRRKR
ncbi:hypothetical protein M438DRAFT_345277 [Aureobasidium pullulans EXF-150]|uniref:Uncharacterized protein n=1 Tax=Aureobasidium pullulans EXF-150 TaxID=1043002 RepID=A0A074XHV4_AURPU|nr:uncharacterized protein M438DRAFT_345277 [Aureobasidium pullulans EXF-150]KEQ85088.1 hypothetical protein M438DRAFT_345277 [Aureobasidium pullulans EXF-150]